MNSYIHHEVWDEITYLYQNSTVQPVRYGDRYMISSHTLVGVCLFIHVGIEIDPW